MSKRIGTIEGCDIVEQDDGSITFTAAARLDGDGANGQFGHPPCYAPAGFAGKTLDVLANPGQLVRRRDGHGQAGWHAHRPGAA